MLHLAQILLSSYLNIYLEESSLVKKRQQDLSDAFKKVISPKEEAQNKTKSKWESAKK